MKKTKRLRELISRDGVAMPIWVGKFDEAKDVSHLMKSLRM